MDSKKSNKIRDIVRLHQLLKKWKKFAKNKKQLTPTESSDCSGSGSGSKSIKFLKKTLSFSDSSTSYSPLPASNDVVKKGFLAVCVGKELKRYVIPTEYLRHQAFRELLREAEEEFGFHQQGVLKIPCEDSIFQMILKAVEDKRQDPLNEDDLVVGGRCSCSCSPEDESQVFKSPLIVRKSNAQMIH